MTLTSRLSLFFLGALALVLAGFSFGLYELAATHLHRQVDERLEAALATLTAAAEIDGEQVLWQPHERQLTIGQDPAADQVRWTVQDDRGKVLDHSANLPADFRLADAAPTIAAAPSPSLIYRGAEPWGLLQRRVAVPPRPSADGDDDGNHQAGDKRSGSAAARLKKEAETPPTKGKRPGRKNSALVLTSGLSLAPVQSTLQQLGWALGGLSAGVWLLAAVLGRWLCGRALLPVRRMAQTARSIHAENLGQRLAVARTGDELADLGTSFNDLLSRLQEAFERQKRFTGDASHQLRTPLTAALGQIEVALRRERSPEEYREVLTMVHGQAEQLRQIVETLLFLARADAEARLPELDELNIGDWLKKHAGQWSSHQRKGDLRLEATDEPLWVGAHPALLGQLVDNLWENATKYSSPGSPITIRLAAASGQVTLTVEDAGSGIAADELPHIFEPFYRSPEARRRGVGGVGLGLAVAQRIVSVFGGSIAVESHPGQGARFTVSLPQVPAPTCRTATSVAVNGHSTGQLTSANPARG